MLIRDVKVKTIRIPLKVAKRFAGRTVSHRDYIIVIINTDEGVSGWSYCWGIPLIGDVIESYFKEHLVGQDPFSINFHWYNMYKAMAVWDRRGISSRAISVIDNALWDLLGKYSCLPIAKLLGGNRQQVPAYFSGGYYPVECKTETDYLEYLENEFGKYYDKGFRAFKMKVGAVDLDLDIKRVELARKTIGDHSDLMIDANNAWDANTAINIGKRLYEYNIKWLEEPVPIDDLPGCARVAEELSIPIAIGENHFTRWDFREIIDIKAAKILQGDPTLMGGITEWLNIAGVAATYGIALAPHWTHDFNIQVGAARPEVMVMEYFEAESDVFNFQLVLTNPVKAVDGFINLPQEPGHGLFLDQEAIKHYELKK